MKNRRAKMHTIATKNITITDPYVSRAQDLLVDYLLSMKSEKFLYEIYKVAKLSPLTEEGYQGWERSNQVNFRGHFFGHYISALSLAYHAEKDEDKKEKLLEEIRVAVNGLEAAQENYATLYPEGAGYISAFREAALDEVEGKDIQAEEKENVLVPWYNLHKILAGLLDAHIHLQSNNQEISEQALHVASRFGDYIYGRMMRLADKNHMLKIEYGGMNDALYHLFSLTKKREHMIAATYFDEDELFEKLANGENALPGRHANTQVPKFIGASKRYLIFQDQTLREFLTEEEKANLDMYMAAAKNFWEIVIEHHTYCTGGHSQSEHFHEPDQLYYDAEMRNSESTCETCNTHNMLKLTRNLYEITQDEKYLHYYERTYINAILASQNPDTGMMMYFQPMGAGYNKVYNRPYDEFWCCTGTGVESFSKLADTYYYEDDQYVYTNLYFSNEVVLEEKNLRVIQETDRRLAKSKFTIQALRQGESETIELVFRLPEWSREYTVSYNGASIHVERKNGFLYLNHPLRDGDEIEIKFRANLKMVATQDNENYVAFEYGPYVLAGGLGKVQMEQDHPNGIMVRVGTKERLLPDTLTVMKEDWDIDCLVPIELEDKLVAFQARDTKEQLIYSPYYEMHGERYGIYFTKSEVDSKAAQDAIKKKKEIIREQEQILDSLSNFDENNSEYAKNLVYHRSEAGAFWGRRYRKALAEGSFSYDFSIDTEDTFYVQFEFHDEDAGKKLHVHFNQQEEYTIEVEKGKSGYYKYEQSLQPSLLNNGKMNLVFSAVEGESPRLFSITFVKSRTYSNQVKLEEVEVTDGRVISQNEGTKQIHLQLQADGKVQFHVNQESCLVYIDDVLIDETEARTLSEGEHQLKLYAPDHETSVTYTVLITK